MLTPARRVFAGHAAGGHARRVRGIHLLWRLGHEARRGAVAVAGWLAVDGRGNGEGVTRVAPESAALGVGEAGFAAQGAEEGVVELLGLVEVAGSPGTFPQHFSAID